MTEWFLNRNGLTQTLIATLCTWGATALGAALIFGVKSVRRALFDGMMSFAGGIMLSAALFSLLLPAFEMAQPVQVCTGFMMGCGFMLLCDWICERHIIYGKQGKDHRNILLIASITLHNIPEGLAIGVAFGTAQNAAQIGQVAAACTLAVGIACQNLPEGFAVSAPLVREGMSKKKAFFFGQLSGMVEVIAGILGAELVVQMQMLLPWMLSCSAGAMIYVVIAELIPESQRSGHKKLMTSCCMGGFTVMMLLDTLLG